jgi:hypothetical protein
LEGLEPFGFGVAPFSPLEVLRPLSTLGPFDWPLK